MLNKEVLTNIFKKLLKEAKNSYDDFNSADGKNIILTSLLAAILGTGVSFLFTKYYSAQISLYPAKKDGLQGLGQFQSLATNFGMNMPENNQDFNIPDVVKSRLIANKVLDQKWLKQNGSKVSLYQLWKMDKPPWYNPFSASMNDTFYKKKRN